MKAVGHWQRKVPKREVAVEKSRKVGLNHTGWQEKKKRSRARLQRGT